MVKAFELQINRVISIIFFCFIYFSQTVDSKFCYWSKATAAIVKSCPKTRLDVEKRAKLKNCQALISLNSELYDRTKEIQISLCNERI